MAQGANKGVFKKGHIPHNIGKPAQGGHNTRFKDGQCVGSKHPSWLGGIQVMKNDCVILWQGNNKRARRPKLIWEKHFGKLPKGYIIYHKDKNKYNDKIDNLEAITRAELLRRNNKSRQI